MREAVILRVSKIIDTLKQNSNGRVITPASFSEFLENLVFISPFVQLYLDKIDKENWHELLEILHTIDSTDTADDGKETEE